MDIQIPSPSVFLRPSPVSHDEPVSPPKKKTSKPRTTPKPKPATRDDSGAVTKPKQSKSRNGCMTCKKKRLKCDETKPSCVQCQKRNVVCEGYKKDFKWRSFEETNLNNKIAAKKRTPNITETEGKRSQKSEDKSWPLDSAFASASRALQNTTVPAIVSPPNSLEPSSLPEDLEPSWTPPPYQLPSPGSAFDLNTSAVSRDANSHSSSFTGSPTLLDLLLPGTDINQPPDISELRPPLSPTPYQPGPFADSMNTDEEVDEEILRHAHWRDPSPARSDISTASSRSSELTVLAGPHLDVSAPEMLLLRFDRQTCGILSVKDGPTENPWRTLVWPLAQNSPALYHAISSMTAFHGIQEHPRLRLAGVAHMHQSIKKLAAEIENMHLDSALATTLALAFGEGWDEKTSTGIQHLRGARIMVNNALVKHRRDCQVGQVTLDESLRLRFLCNTFIYMDVIARLTSIEEASGLNLDEILEVVDPPTTLHEVDPLMGCASTLFPLIGRVASLIQKVRKTETNSLSIVSQANELFQQLLQWHTPNALNFLRPEDPSSEVEHSIRTADAYRMATLLYLHQAVPEIPSDRHEAMAKRVLLLLASVPLSSRTTIVQIFPLFAASCEVTNHEDRAWVTERWAAMMARLTIGNVDSCWRVVQEVWHRRDAYEADKVQRLIHFPNMPRRSAMADIPLDQIDPEYSVRGKLHWIGVMSEWKWEVFLG